MPILQSRADIILDIARQHQLISKVQEDLIQSGYKIIKGSIYSLLVDRPGSRQRIGILEFEELMWNIECDKRDAFYTLKDKNNENYPNSGY